VCLVATATSCGLDLLKGVAQFSFFIFFFPLGFSFSVRTSGDTQLTTLRAAAVLLDREKNKN
jgi:hypothetical protein